MITATPLLPTPALLMETTSKVEGWDSRGVGGIMTGYWS